MISEIDDALLTEVARITGGRYFRARDAATGEVLWEHEVVGASPFPRHGVYDDEGRLVEKSGTLDFEQWLRAEEGEAHGRRQHSADQ